MTLTIGKRIIVGFTVSIIITGVLGIFAYRELLTIDKVGKSIVNDSLPGTVISGDMEANTQRAVSLLLQHILAEDKQRLDEIENNMRGVTEELNKSYKDYEATVFTDTDRALFGQAAAARQGWLTARAKTIALSQEGKKKEAGEVFTREVYPAVVKVREAVGALADYNKKDATEGGREMAAAVASGKLGVMIGIAAALSAGAVLSFLIVRSTNKVLSRIAASLGEGSEQVASASTQVSSSSQAVAQGASEQAASLEETTSALEEMSSMTKKNAETAQQASSISNETEKAAAKGNTAMNKMSSAINDIQKSASETAKIIKVIDEIAFQTNLLALNAAVEAARAGEAGKGFAVVAEEVRNLAMRSAEAAKNTASMIEESVNNAKNGVTIAVEVGKNLEEITTSTTKVNSLVGEIAAASKEQSQGIEQINTAIGQMDKVTQANAASAEESASASEELTGQAESLHGIVNELIMLVNGAGAVHVAAARGAGPRRTAGVGRGTGKAAPAARKAVSAAAQIPLDSQESKQSAAAFAEFSAAK